MLIDNTHIPIKGTASLLRDNGTPGVMFMVGTLSLHSARQSCLLITHNLITSVHINPALRIPEQHLLHVFHTIYKLCSPFLGMTLSNLAKVKGKICIFTFPEAFR